MENGTGHEKVFAVEALAAFGKESFEQLVKLLKDKHPDTKTASMLALMKLAPKKALAPLLDVLKTEKDADLRYNAWYCITNILNPKRKEITLQKFIDDERQIVKDISAKVGNKLDKE